ncbi:Hypothetical protein FKW44_020023, partial [Caligus rogercresseyi]
EDECLPPCTSAPIENNQETHEQPWASKDGQQLQSEELIQDLEMEEAEDIRADPVWVPPPPPHPLKWALVRPK